MTFDKGKARAVLRNNWYDPDEAPEIDWVLDRLAECWTEVPHALHGYTLEEWEHRAARAEARLDRIAALCERAQRGGSRVIHIEAVRAILGEAS